MRRRTLLQQLPALLAAPALAQAPADAKLLVVLSPYARPATGEGDGVLLDELARRGWRPGHNLRVEARYAEHRPDRLDAMARELAALQPTAALAVTESAVRALMRHTTRVPMIVGFAADPVAGGLASTLRRPGGQVSGLTLQIEDLRPKTYELARQVVPAARRLATLFDRRHMLFEEQDADVRRLTLQLGFERVPLPVHEASGIEAALRSLTPAREHVLEVSPGSLMFAHHRSTATLARTLRLPAFSQLPQFAKAGGLFSYGPDGEAMWRRAVQMADQVLRGQPVGDIPFEQPTRIVFTLNRSTAESIGLALPRELMLRADEVIG